MANQMIFFLHSFDQAALFSLLQMEDVLSTITKIIDDPSKRTSLSSAGLEVSGWSLEDSSFQKYSVYGDNITSLSLSVCRDNMCHIMPVIRHVKYIEKTCHIPVSNFILQVGQSNETLKSITLNSMLEHWQDFLFDKQSIDPGSSKSLLEGKGDSHAVVSAQACLLPMEPNSGFYPYIYNYKSYYNCPGVLCITSSTQGTNITISGRDADDHKLYSNANGKRAPFQQDNEGVILFIQVPLKQPKFRTKDLIYRDHSTSSASLMISKDSYLECDSLKIERDTSKPIRVTVQFYYSISNTNIPVDLMKQISQNLQSIYQNGDVVTTLLQTRMRLK